jgi:heme oxygenase
MSTLRELFESANLYADKRIILRRVLSQLKNNTFNDELISWTKEDLQYELYLKYNKKIILDKNQLDRIYTIVNDNDELNKKIRDELVRAYEEIIDVKS